MTEGTEVIRTEGHELAEGEQLLPPIADQGLVVIAEQAEKRVEAMNKIKRMALKLTNRHDWVDENGKPYLQASGAEKVGRLFGISWRISEPTIENLDAGHWLVTYTGEFSLAGATITAVGTRSSKDGFFKKYKYIGTDRVELPASEIDRGNVKKAAYTNLLGNGITRLLGIRNLTYEDLQECAGIRQQDITSVAFKKGGKAAVPTQPGKESPKDASAYPSQPDTPATEAQCTAIYGLLKDKLGLQGELEKHEKVAKLLGLKEIPTSMGKLTTGQAGTVIQKLQKEAAGGTQAPEEGEA